MVDIKYEFWNDPSPLLGTVARLFAKDGSTKEVAILANASATIEQTDYDNWNGGTYKFAIYLQIPHWLYSQVESEMKEIEKHILEKIHPILLSYPNEDINEVLITPALATDTNWQEKAKTWLAGENISNQGRVRSDNIAARTKDGLLFRSQPEINLYQAFKSLGISFAPLPVFIRGGETYRRIEPDFILIKDGIMMAVEVDGDTVHHETPEEAHARTTMLVHEGVYLERVRASRCDTTRKAIDCAHALLEVLQKHRQSR